MTQRTLSELDLLLAVLPPRLRELLRAHPQRDALLEVVLDLGRLPEARFADHMEVLSAEPVSRADLDHVVARVGTFGKDNRAGIERTLHRISAIRNRLGTIIGLTCRVGRALFGTVDIVRDVIESGKSLLLLGRPGVGKTTLLREAARVLADELGKRVVIVDTSNEIAGDGDIPHPGIGRARRMQVPTPHEQHAVMIEAVENHMPEVIVIDEIGTEAEALAARTIAERGVQLIATAHGNTLDNLLRNPTLADLVGGVQAVTLSDEEARRRRTQKTVLERKAPPTFDVLIEIQERDRLAVYHNVAQVVDAFLRGVPLRPELRLRRPDGSVEVQRAAALPAAAPANGAAPPPPRRPQVLRIFPYAVNRSRLERAIRACQVPAYVVNSLEDANLVLTLKSQEKHQARRLHEAQARGVPLYVLRNNTVTQMVHFLQAVFDGEASSSQKEAALREAEAAIHEVLEEGHPVELSPQNTYLRRLQHQLAARYGLFTQSLGSEPERRVVIYPA
ncbi:MAG: single-stranded DNA-binding protein [Candidatus Tectimicrobiota bacterium]|nr:MAG: single-stranded DNA-binding protein [Candidatus Tectomicrobia bacterium]